MAKNKQDAHPENDESAIVAFRIPKGVRKQLKQAALDKDTSVQHLGMSFIVEGLKRMNPTAFAGSR